MLLWDVATCRVLFGAFTPQIWRPVREQTVHTELGLATGGERKGGSCKNLSTGKGEQGNGEQNDEKKKTKRLPGAGKGHFSSVKMPWLTHLLMQMLLNIHIGV